MLTIPTIPGQDTIGVYSGGFNSTTSVVGNFYLLTDPTSTFYLVSPENNNVYPTYSSVFSPLSLSPALWLDDTGSDLGVWADMSGNGRNAIQATGANQPSIVTNAVNGRQVRRFNGTSSVLIPPDFNLDVFTIFSVVYPTNAVTANPYKAIFNIGTALSSSARDVIVYINNSSGVKFEAQRSDGSSFPTASVATNNLIFQITSSKFTGDELIAYVNNGIRNITSTTMTGSTDNKAVIGAVKQSSSTNFYYEGDIAELIVYPTNLSDFNCLRVERYLSNKYNIVID